MSRSSKTLCRRDLLKAGLAGTAGLASRPLAAFSEPLSPVLPLPEPQQTNASAQELSWEEQISLRRLQPVRTVVDEVPVYAFGDTFIYAITPTLVGESRLQEGNASPARKIKPKKSWELKSNTFGATAPRVPRSEINDYQPFVGVNLIDGNPETCWMSRGQNQPDVEPVWVRIDLAKETQAKKVVLVPRWDNQGLPNDLVVQVSRDGWHWDTVFTDTNFRASHASGRFEIAFPARQIKQVMVRANNCSEVNVPDQYGEPTWTFDFCFSLAGIEVLEENDANVALISRGAGVTVSSTTRGFGDEKLLHDQLWPIHYDLGLKWVRVAYWDSVLNWLYVEQEKGKRRIDPWTDKVITECCRNGINVVLCLAYGNWNYTPEGHRPHPRQIFETPWEMPPAPTTLEMLEGYKEFVRFMVRHFRDRIRYFEIWNEPDGKYAWGNKPNPAEYAELVKQIAPIIRAEAPNCKILMAAVGSSR